MIRLRFNANIEFFNPTTREWIRVITPEDRKQLDAMVANVAKDYPRR
jgi:hypothetical protein